MNPAELIRRAIERGEIQIQVRPSSTYDELRRAQIRECMRALRALQKLGKPIVRPVSVSKKFSGKRFLSTGALRLV